MKRLRILVLMLKEFVPPESKEGRSEKELAKYKTEWDVLTGLQKLGHDVRPLGVTDDLSVIRTELTDYEPHIAFNLLEEFGGVSWYSHYVVSFLELMHQRYTGCNPRGLMLSQDKALSKKILAYHRIHVPDFAVFGMKRKVRRPTKLKFPLLVKSITEQGSIGISQASLVTSDEKLRERVEFVHEQLFTDAIAEEYIEGRELYVGVMGHHRVELLPTWEMCFENLAEGAPRIATERLKWDTEYQESRGVSTKAALEVPTTVQADIERICRRLYKVLHLSGYARVDLRVTAEGKVYVLEANPNPQLAHHEDFADSAELAGYSYGQLLQRILDLGMSYRAAWQMWY